MADRDDGLVYSTDHGRMCPRCGKPADRCSCPRQSSRGSGASGRIRVQLSTRGRKGKTVSVISGLDLDAFALAELARELKQRCGTGGTVKDGTIEIQGDHVRLIVEFLAARGHDAG